MTRKTLLGTWLLCGILTVTLTDTVWAAWGSKEMDTEKIAVNWGAYC
jgi:hypothetical protein